MATVGKAFIEIRGDDSKLGGDLDGVKRQIDDFAGSLKAAFGAAVAGFSAKEVWGWTRELAAGAAKVTDDLADFAQMSGVALDKVYQLKYAFGAAGESWEESAEAIGMLARNVGLAAEGVELQATAFAKMGISVRDSRGQIKSTDQVLLEMADAFSKLADGPQKVALAMEVAGRGGKALIPILSEGGQKLQELIDKATSKGYVISPDAAAEAARYLGSVNELDNAMEGLWREMGENLRPVMTELNHTFTEWVEENKEWIAKDMAGVLNTVAAAVTTLGNALEIVTPTLKFFISSLETAVDGIGRIWKTLENMGSWIPGLEPSYDITASKDWWIPSSGKDQWAQFKRDQKAIAAAQEWQSVFGKPDRSIDVSRITDEMSRSAKSASSSFAEFNRQLEIQIKLANLDYEALQRLGEMVRQSVVGPGGAAVSPTMLEAVPERGGFPDLGTQFDLAPLTIPGFDEASLEKFWGQYNQLNDLLMGGAWGTMWQQIGFEIDAMRPVIEDSLNNMINTLTTKQQMVQQIAQVFASAFTSMFSTGMQKGFKEGVKAFLGAMVQGIGMIIAQWGAMLFTQGLFEVIFGSSPITPNPPAVAHGVKAMAIGLAMMAGGGLVAGIGGAIGGGGASSGAASSYQSAGSAGTQAIEPVTYTMGRQQEAAAGQPVSITINAMDSQSFNDYLEKNGESGVTSIMARSFRSNGVAREMSRW